MSGAERVLPEEGRSAPPRTNGELVFVVNKAKYSTLGKTFKSYFSRQRETWSGSSNSAYKINYAISNLFKTCLTR